MSNSFVPTPRAVQQDENLPPEGIINKYSFNLNSANVENQGSVATFKFPQQISCTQSTSFFNVYVTQACTPNLNVTINDTNNTFIMQLEVEQVLDLSGNPISPVWYNCYDWSIQTFNQTGVTDYLNLFAFGLSVQDPTNNTDLSITMPNANYTSVTALINDVNFYLNSAISAMNNKFNTFTWSQFRFLYNTYPAPITNWTLSGAYTANNTTLMTFGCNNTWGGLFARYRWKILSSEIWYMLGFPPGQAFYITGPLLPGPSAGPTTYYTTTQESNTYTNLNPSFITYFTSPTLTQAKSFASEYTLNGINVQTSNVLCSIPTIYNAPYSFVNYSVPAQIPILNRILNEVQVEVRDYTFRLKSSYFWGWSLTLIIEEINPVQGKPPLNIKQLNDIDEQLFAEKELELKLQMQMLKNKKQK